MRTDNITMPEKLTFTDFMKAFRAQYMYGTPDLKNFLITEQQIHKNNKNLHGIIIRSPGKRIAPVSPLRMAVCILPIAISKILS